MYGEPSNQVRGLFSVVEFKRYPINLRHKCVVFHGADR